MTPTPTVAPPAFIAWLRIGRGPFKAAAGGATYAEASQRLDEYIGQHVDAPHIETYVGSRGTKPPMRRQ